MRKFTRLGGLGTLNKYSTHHFGAAAIAAGVGAAGSIASAAIQSGGAEGAAGLQTEYLDLGIDELRNALGPSMARLDKEQGWSDRYLRNQFRAGMRDTDPYAAAGRRGLSRLNYLMGTDNGLGPQPTAPKAPKAPKYSKDPKTAAAQRKAYEKAQRVYGRAKTKYDTDSAAWTAATTAQANDPEFGSMMEPYDDRFEGRIDEVAKREYEDKHGFGQRILDTAAEKYDDKYADEILGVARDKFEQDDLDLDTGYNFRRSEGNRGVEQSAAARGGLQSGAAQKELVRFNQELAKDEVGAAHGRWADQHDRHLGGLQGQQAADYGFWSDNKGTRLNALSGERAFDYGAWDDLKDTELGSLVDRRNFDFSNFEDNRDFQYGALNDMVGVGERAVDDRNQLREHFSNQRTGNRINTAVQQGNWRNQNAAAIAEFLAAQGGAQAGGQINSANAWGNAFQGAGNALGTAAGYYYGGRRGNGLVHRTPTA